MEGWIPPTPEEGQKIISWTAERAPSRTSLVRLAAITGARRSELCGLRWSDVDLEAGVVVIQRSLLDTPELPWV